MKKYLSAENIIFLGTVPAIFFLVSRLIQLSYSVVEKSIGDIAGAVAFVVAIAVAFFAKSKIAEYFKRYDNGTVANIVIACVSVIFSVLCREVILRNCMAGGKIVSLAGGAILLGVFLNILVHNVVNLFKSAKGIKISKYDIIFLAVALLILNCQAFVYCKYMKQIFFWDNAGYFTTVHSLNDIFPSFEYWRTVFDSIFTTDYNYIIAIPASIMCKLFGKSRLVFILSIINFYIYPLVAVLYFLTKRVFKGNIIKTVSVFVCLPYLIFMANAGFIDIGCVVPGIIALALYWYYDKDKVSILIGVLLALCIYMRRWYSFFAVSFVIVAFVHGVFTKKIKVPLEIVGSCGFVLLFFTQDFVFSKLLADYSNMYVAYALGIRYDVMIFTRYYGVILTGLLAVYVIVMQIRNRKRLCPETAIGVQALLCFGLFVSVQTHGQQHLALYIPAFCMVLMSLLSKLNKRHQYVAAAVLCAFQTANTFVPRVQPTSIQAIEHAALVPNFSNYPRIEEDDEKILDITEYMDEHIGLNGKTVCVLASSFELNYDIITNAEASLSVKKKHDIERRDYFIPISDVDKRDGLSDNLFITDYILVPSVVQTHLAENEQRVISVPHQHIVNGTGFGTAYEKEDVSFDISDDTEVYLYRRTRDITAEEKEALSKEIFNQ